VRPSLVLFLVLTSNREESSCLIPANVPHAVNARLRFKMLLAMIR
jgi:hypothetical protein